jgi:hypothetical protein
VDPGQSCSAQVARSEAEGRRQRGRLFLVTSFGEAKEVTRPPGRTPGLVVRQPGLNVSLVAKRRCEAVVVFEVAVEV